MNSKKDCHIGFGILPTDVYFQYTTVRKCLYNDSRSHLIHRLHG